MPKVSNILHEISLKGTLSNNISSRKLKNIKKNVVEVGIDGENKKERRALFLRLLEESEINGRYSAPRVAR